MDCHPVHALHVGANFSYVNARLLHQPEEMKWLPMTPALRLSADLNVITGRRGVFNMGRNFVLKLAVPIG